MLPIVRLPRVALLSVASLLLACLVLPAPDASAQCFGPDNLSIGACCVPTVPTLPVFPGGSLPGLGICRGQCTVTNTRTLKVAWTPPAQPYCAGYTTNLTVFDGTSGTALLGGTITLDYTRTWEEVDPSGVGQQIWRFTAKADLVSLLPPGTPPCPVPNCIAPAGPYPTAFFYGYVDYASCAGLAPFENVLVLYHACDRFIHAPGLSSTPGAFHPGSSFAIVAPSSALQPFTPANAIAPGGNVIGEATRNVTPSSLVCTTEDPVAVGAMTPLGAGCICNLAANPKQQTLRQFQGSNACVVSSFPPGGWATLNVSFPGLPWFHMVSTSIGSWGNPNVYPGNEFAWVDEGLFAVQDACTGGFVELKYGGSTRGGWTVTSIPGSPTSFTDLVDNYTAPLLGPYPTPILGTVLASNHLIYVNEP